jgi:hypothetical protein
VEADLGYVLTGLRQAILNIHRSWPRRLLGKDLPSLVEELQLLERSLLQELRDIGDVGKACFLQEHEEGEEGDDDDHELHDVKAKKKAKHGQ